MVKTRVKVDEEEALTARTTTRTRTRTEATPTLIQGGTPSPSGGQSGPTTRSQTQAQQEQGAKREHEGGDDGNAKKRSRFMRMARKLRKQGVRGDLSRGVLTGTLWWHPRPGVWGTYPTRGT